MSHDNAVTVVFVLVGVLEGISGWFTTRATYNLSNEALHRVFSWTVGATVFVVPIVLLWHVQYLNPLTIALAAAAAVWLRHRISEGLNLWSALFYNRIRVQVAKNRVDEIKTSSRIRESPGDYGVCSVRDDWMNTVDHAKRRYSARSASTGSTLTTRRAGT